MNEQLFANCDLDIEGPHRNLVGYAKHAPAFSWPGGARVAVQLAVNYEEGSEKSFPMGDNQNDVLGELPLQAEGVRDLALESTYEYGSRAGIWRLFRIFDAGDVPISCFAVAVALERNVAVAEELVRRRDEVVAHGFRWTDASQVSRDEEAEIIRRAVISIRSTTGSRPVGWFSRRMSTNTRELLVEEGGFIYDSEAFNDDIPYWTHVLGRPHLVVPYTHVLNDVRFVLAQGFSSPDDFYAYMKASLDRLRADGDGASRMMSVGLHPRITGQPARADALARFIDYGRQFEDVWFARRVDIAKEFSRQVPASTALNANVPSA